MRLMVRPCRPRRALEQDHHALAGGLDPGLQRAARPAARTSAFRNCAAACGGGRIDALAPVHGQLVVRIAAADRPCTFTSSKARCTARASSGDSSSITARSASCTGRGRRPGSGGRCRPARRPSPGGRRPRARRRGGAAGRQARRPQRAGGPPARPHRRRPCAPARGAAPRCDRKRPWRLRVASAVSDSVDGVVLSVMVMVLAARGGPERRTTARDRRGKTAT